MKLKTFSKLAFVCPGQGVQQVGMIKNLRNLKVYNEVMSYAKLALGDRVDWGKNYIWNIEKLMVEGPESELNMTVNTGPAVLIMSLLNYYKYKEQDGMDVTDYECGFGFSLGEVTAATICECISLYDAIKLAKDRSILMQNAWPQSDDPLTSGKVIVFLEDADIIRPVLEQFKLDLSKNNDSGPKI